MNNNLQHYVKPMRDFAVKFGSLSQPFVPSLVRYFDEHINASAVRSDVEFWLALGTMDNALGWAAAAFTKANWSTDAVKHGICRGVRLGGLAKLNGSPDGRSRMRQLSDFLGEVRKESSPILGRLDAKPRCQIEGRLDDFAARVGMDGSMKTMRPRSNEIWELKSFADVRLVFQYDCFCLGRSQGPCPDMRGLTAEIKSASTTKINTKQ